MTQMFIDCLTHPERAHPEEPKHHNSLWGLTLEFSSLNCSFLKELVQLNVRACFSLLGASEFLLQNLNDKVKLRLIEN